jgi:hypothetical protein
VTWHELDALLSHVWPSAANQASHNPTMTATKVQSDAGTKSWNTGQTAAGVSCGVVEEAEDRSPEKVFLVATATICFRLGRIRSSHSPHVSLRKSFNQGKIMIACLPSNFGGQIIRYYLRRWRLDVQWLPVDLELVSPIAHRICALSMVEVVRIRL